MPEVPSIDYESSDLEEDIQELIDISLLELNTCMPGVIQSYDSATQTCTVRPSFKRTFADGVVRRRADISDVHVMFPRSGASGVHFPINKGDSVLIVFSQRSLDDWVDKGGVVTLEAYRMHNITDAIVIPGLHSLADKLSPAPKDKATELRGEKIFIGDHSQQTASLTYGASAGAIIPTPGTFLPTELDLLSIVEALIDIVMKSQYGVIGTGGGLIGADSVTALSKLLLDLQKLKVT